MLLMLSQPGLEITPIQRRLGTTELRDGAEHSEQIVPHLRDRLPEAGPGDNSARGRRGRDGEQYPGCRGSI